MAPLLVPRNDYSLASFVCRIAISPAPGYLQPISDEQYEIRRGTLEAGRLEVWAPLVIDVALFALEQTHG